MNIKEQIREILGDELLVKDGVIYASDKTIDQILDLVLNALTIEKKDDNPDSTEGRWQEHGWNQCVDAYEELKNKLRK